MFFFIARLLGLLVLCAGIFYLFVLWARDEDKKETVKVALHDIELTIKLAEDANFNTKHLVKARARLKELVKRSTK